MIPTPVKDALIAAGGCEHTPEPQKGCDTCGRPPAPWASAERRLYRWRATTIDGAVLDKLDVLSVSNLQLDRIVRLEILLDDERIPMIALSCDPRKGERLHMFTRRSIKMNPRTASQTGIVSIPVFEVILDQDKPDRFVRLYWHPERGPILSTEDLRF